VVLVQIQLLVPLLSPPLSLLLPPELMLLALLPLVCLDKPRQLV
jgi:hypothetical protein